MTGITQISSNSSIQENHEIKLPSPENEEENIVSNIQPIVNVLPNEIIQSIFSNLELQDLANCSKVCNRWHDLANNNIFWKPLIEDKEIDFSGKSVKKYITENCPAPGAILCRSLDKAMSIMLRFFRELKIEQKGKFCVMFPPSKGEIIVECVFSKNVGSMNLPDKKPDITKTCFLINSKTDDFVSDKKTHTMAFNDSSLSGYGKYQYYLPRSKESKTKLVCMKILRL